MRTGARSRSLLPTGCLALLALAAPESLAGQQNQPAEALPATTLAVRDGDGWHTWWRAQAAPAQWSRSDSRVVRAITWQPVRAGIERGVLDLAGDGSAWRFRVILVRLDTDAYRLRLRQALRDAGLAGAWSLDSVSADAVVALNAGQFTGGTPWGWLVIDGTEVQPPGAGPLSTAIVAIPSGGVRLLSPTEADSARSAGGVAEAFQSYPTLLREDGVVPEALRAAGRGVDVQHRDARLAVCSLRDGRLLFALTRFTGLGATLQQLPVGPTTPEMAALMGALGCARAVMLDGGLSSQLLVRGDTGVVQRWPGMRRVPLGLEIIARSN